MNNVEELTLYTFQAPGVPQDYNVPKIFSLNSGSSWNRETINISVPHQALPDTKFVFIAITGNTFSNKEKKLKKIK